MNLVSCVIQKDDISHIDELNIKFVVVHDRGMALRSHHRYNKEPTQAKNSRTVSDSSPMVRSETPCSIIERAASACTRFRRESTRRGLVLRLRPGRGCRW